MDASVIAKEIETTLHDAIPTGHTRDVTKLAELLSAAVTQECSLEEIGKELSATPQILNLIHELIGAQINANGTTVNFNNDSITVGLIQNSDTVAIGNGASAIKLTVQLDQRISPEEKRRRVTMIDKVRSMWIDGVLKHSLQHMSLINLGFETHKTSQRHPWRLIGQWYRKPDHHLPPNISITDVYDRVGKELLLLGEPGTGKTTALLLLAKDLLDRAEQDVHQPIPVIFNLSSFSTWRGTFKEWLIEELQLRYAVPPTLGRQWITTGTLLLLLDGLDEVAEVSRNACVLAINTFRKKEYGLDQMVVCSRIDDYVALQQQLDIPAVLKVVPISVEQLTNYLESGGKRIAPIRELLTHDEQLAEMARTPLMLSMIILAYENNTNIPSLTSGSFEARRAQIFEHYIKRMLSYPEGERIYGIELADTPTSSLALPYTPKQTLHYLAWLAAKMKELDKSLFLIEELQPNWLNSRGRWIYIFFLMLTSALLFGLIGGLGRELAIASALGLILGITGFWRWTGWLLVVFGLLLSLRRFLFEWPTEVWLFTFDAALIYGLVGSCIMMGLNLRFTKCFKIYLQPQPIQIAERLIWSWPQALRGFFNSIAFGAMIILSLALVGNILAWFESSSWSLSIGQWILGFSGAILAFGSIVSLILMPIWGLSVAEIPTRTLPGKGISQTGRNALIVGLTVGLGLLIFSTILHFMGQLMDYLKIIDSETNLYAFVDAFTVIGRMLIGNHFIFQIMLSLGLGLATSLGFGGFAYIQHFLLRTCLQQEGAIPLDLVKFLDFVTKRRLLFRAGGSYKFIHNTLREHLATIEFQNIDKEAVYDEAKQNVSSEGTTKSEAISQTLAD
jgi:Predicted NTPase (NACHT family)